VVNQTWGTNLISLAIYILLHICVLHVLEI
jgi:hypothetical protein